MLVKQYKKHKIEKNDGVFEVVSPSGSRYIPALDDSKTSGRRRFINKENNIIGAKKLINALTK